MPRDLEVAARLAELFAIAAGIGAPAGAAAALAKRKLNSKPEELVSPSTYTELPLVPGVGPVREKQSDASLKGILSALRHPVDTYYDLRGAMSAMRPIEKYPPIAAGLGLGGAASYGALDEQLEQEDAATLDEELAEREQRFNDLLLAEQGVTTKAAEVLDDAVTTVFEDTFEKASSQLSPETVASLAALIGASYGLLKGVEHEELTNPNRIQARALRSSLDQRLTGNPEGPRAPMVVKVKTNRIGSTPIGGKSGSPGRDALSRL